MASPARSSFERALSRLDRESLAQFVADLYAARGVETSVDGTHVRLQRATGVETLAVVSPNGGRIRQAVSRMRQTTAAGDTSEHSREAVDGAVVVGGNHDRHRAGDASQRRIGPRELYRLLLYGVDRATAESLCQQYFDRSVTEFTQSPDDASTEVWSPRNVGVVLVALVVVTAAIALGMPLGAETPDGDRAAGGDVAPTAGNASDGTADAQQEGSTDSTQQSVDYPTGLSERGVTDARALAVAHRNAVGNRSRQVAIRGSGHVVPADGVASFENGSLPVWETFNQQIAIERHGIYHSQLIGTPSDGSSMVARQDYFDGEQTYRRESAGAVTYDRVNLSPTTVAVSVAGSIERYLRTDESTVERLDDGRFRVVATDDPAFLSVPVTGYRAVAIMDQDGVVRSLRITYRDLSVADPDGRLRILYLSVDNLGEQGVDRPAWYESARNATGTAAHPPGINPDAGEHGSVTPLAVAETHGAALNNRSYYWQATHEGPLRIGRWQSRAIRSWRRATVADDRTYLAHVNGLFLIEGNEIPVTIDRYADGEYEYSRVGAGGFAGGDPGPSSYSRMRFRSPTHDRFATIVERDIHRFLAAEQVTLKIVNNGTRSAETGSQSSPGVEAESSIRYRIVATGTPSWMGQNIRSFRAVANVTADGLVRDLTVEYVVVNAVQPVPVTVEHSYSDVGNATVSEPAWYDDARAYTEE